MHENMRATGDATAQVCAELMIRNAGTVQQALHSGAEIAVRMTDYSAANINAIVRSNVDWLVEMTADHIARLGAFFPGRRRTRFRPVQMFAAIPRASASCRFPRRNRARQS